MLSDVHRWRSQWQEPRIMILKLKFLKDYSLLKNLKLQSSQTSGTQLISVYDLWKCLEEKISKLWASLSKGFPENRISNNGLRRLFESSLKAKCWGIPLHSERNRPTILSQQVEFSKKNLNTNWLTFAFCPKRIKRLISCTSSGRQFAAGSRRRKLGACLNFSVWTSVSELQTLNFRRSKGSLVKDSLAMSL